MKQTDRRDVCGERMIFLFIFLLVSFSDLRKSDRRLLSEQKGKFDYAKRATYKYQYLSLLLNVKI